MTTLVYPLFCVALGENEAAAAGEEHRRRNILASVPGQPWQVVGDSMTKIKKILAEHARKAAAEDLYWYTPEIDQAKLRLTTVKLRLSYREKKGQYPLPLPLSLQIAAVYGHNQEQGYWKCYLPLLESEFFYYDERQLTALIEHFTRTVLEGQPPEYVHRYLLPSTPWLDQLRIQIDVNQPALQRPTPDHSQAIARLRGVAEPLPLPAATRRKINRLPEPAWERGALIEPLVKQFLQQPRNLILVGEQGVGKTTIWLEVIRRVTVATQSQTGRPTFWRSSAARLTADARYLGEWQQICEDTVADLAQVNGVLWMIDLIHLFGSAQTDSADSVAAFLLPLLQTGKLVMIGEMSPQQVTASQRLLPGFLDHFKLITVAELNSEQLHQVMDQLATYSAKNLNIQLTPEAITLALRLLQRYQRYARFPGKAMGFFAALIRAKQQSGDQLTEIDTRDVINLLLDQTGLPELILRDELPLEQTTLMAFFNQRVIGQETALRALYQIIATYKAGLNDPDKPIATLLFTGPTGVGKTAAAKALAELFFSAGQTQQPLLRVDMSEFQHPQQIDRLIGDGYSSAGKLVEHVRANPFSVILLDEIEKASPPFFDILLAVLDEGRLQDAFGRLTDFRGCIIVMTSNLGATQRPAAGFVNMTQSTFDTASNTTAVRQFFRPEFYNRIDQVLVFHPLNTASIRRIVQKELAEIGHREGIQKRQLTLHFSTALIDFICAQGFSPRYGARPLQRAIEALVVSTISQFLLHHPTHRCDLYMDIDQQGKVVISPSIAA